MGLFDPVILLIRQVLNSFSQLPWALSLGLRVGARERAFKLALIVVPTLDFIN